MPVRAQVIANARIKTSESLLYEKVRFVIGDNGTIVRLYERGHARGLIGEYAILDVEKNRQQTTVTVEVDGEPVTWFVTKNGCGCGG